MTHEVRDAVRILADCYWAIDPDLDMPPEQKLAAHLVLARAIRHIASPDRAVYPKVRRSSKRRPVRRSL